MKITDLRAVQPPTPGSPPDWRTSLALPDDWPAGGAPRPAVLAEAVRRECRRIGARLDAARPRRLPPTWRRPARFLALAGELLLRRARQAPEALAARPPQLGIGSRLGLLVRARWL